MLVYLQGVLEINWIGIVNSGIIDKAAIIKKTVSYTSGIVFNIYV